MRFLPWHLNFFCRYRPLPEGEFAEAARQHPLLQSRLDARAPAIGLERLLADTRRETHQRIAEELMDSATGDEALGRARRLAASLPPETTEGALQVPATEVAG
jgi:tRNA-dihydrouridine synthase 3